MNLRERIAKALESFCIDDGTTTQFYAAVDAVLAALPEAVPAWIWSLDPPEVSGWRWIETWDETAMCFDVLRFHVGDKLQPNVAAWRYVDPPSSRLPQIPGHTEERMNLEFKEAKMGEFRFTKGDTVPEWVEKITPAGIDLRATFGADVVVERSKHGAVVYPEREIGKDECVIRFDGKGIGAFIQGGQTIVYMFPRGDQRNEPSPPRQVA